jgi:predicted O-methyltransferase YrrM
MKKEKGHLPAIEEIEQFIICAGSDNIGVFGGSHEGGIHCQQIPDEIAPAILTILESGERIEAYLEIGVAAGGTTFLIDHYFHPEKIVLVDDNKHHKAGLRGEILKGIKYQEIIGRSDDEEVIKTVSKIAPYDVILIDGDHLYPGVKLDTISYLPMLRPGGFLILHDSALPEWGVARVVRELKTDPGVEFIGEYVSTKHPRPLGVALCRKARQ